MVIPNIIILKFQHFENVHTFGDIVVDNIEPLSARYYDFERV